MGSRSSLGDPRVHSLGEERTNHERSELPHHLHRTIAAGGSPDPLSALKRVQGDLRGFVLRRATMIQGKKRVNNGCLIKTEKDGHFTVRPDRNREKH